MGILRPATPGFVVTLTATILLAVVSFSVPWFKSVYFLKANLSVENVNGSITFGTLGYCLELSNGTTCSKPSVGYELNVNALVGNDLPIQIPQVAVKWLTYALVLHIVALVLAAISAFFGLLAHVREMSMTCFSSCVSGFAATVALLAFIFDLALFFIARSRMNSVSGGSASMGNGIWLTLAAWILLFFSGCFFGFGRCCIRRRPRSPGDRKEEDRWNPPAIPGGSDGTGYAEQRRLDAVKAEADRKARQARSEGGLPAFQEYQPLSAMVEGDSVYVDEEVLEHPYRDHVVEAGRSGAGRRQPTTDYAGGYVQAPAGTRAVDDYYSPTRSQSNNSYPPRRRQESVHTQATSGYAPSTYTYNSSPQVVPPVAPPVPVTAPQQSYLTPGNQYSHQQYPSGQTYGHTAGGTTYHSATSHQQDQSYYDPYSNPSGFAAPTQAIDHSFNPETYNNTAMLMPSGSSASPYHSNSPVHTTAPERGYTVGGGGYGDNVIPAFDEPAPIREHADPYMPYPGTTSPSHLATSPAPLDTAVGGSSFPQTHTSPVRGPRQQRSSVLTPQYEDSPPMYEETPGTPGGWSGSSRNEKR
ncbi:pali-domain-containing protein [Neolentinus lepideus HHB14362 ss-1]|uniref:Pali-domain-containing protein n=1 Tax=Neolentinus lepideus HHB14362 ss-1 TaxID=1314782 RepID=A0A165WAU5_9AGAM|nr:pali-domain-containing protein [Neolentinus lepideus HHB14362 ss-1]